MEEGLGPGRVSPRRDWAPASAPIPNATRITIPIRMNTMPMTRARLIETVGVTPAEASALIRPIAS
jgi:hypothetical protein